MTAAKTPFGFALLLVACGGGAGQAVRESTPTEPVPTEAAPTEAAPAADESAAVEPLAEDRAAWVRARTGGSPVGPLTVPESFFTEDSRYRGLVPDAPVERLVEAWVRGEGGLTHRYEVTVVRSDGNVEAIDARLLTLGRAHTRDAHGTITAPEDPRVLAIPMADGSALRLVVSFHAGSATRDYDAFVAALPELGPVRATLGLDTPPDDSRIELGTSWRSESQWRVSGEDGARIETLLPAQGYERRDDGWVREVGARRIVVSVDPLDRESAVVVSVSGDAR